MKRVFAEEVKDMIGSSVFMKGWIFRIKAFGKFAFVTLRDKTGLVQLIVEDEELIRTIKIETAVEVMGLSRENANAPGGVEVYVKDMKIVGKTYYDLMPFSINTQKVSASLETELDYRYISLRRPDRRAVFKVEEEVSVAFRLFCKSQGFSEIFTPKIIASGTEGGSEMFTVNYFDTRAFLAQSPQFYKQMMVGAGFEAVFEEGHAYRAEQHNTWRHLNEYVSLDIEMGFIKDEFDLMDFEERFLNYMFDHLRMTCAKELSMYGVTLPENISIPRIPLYEAQAILLEKFDKKSPTGNIDAEGEALFSKYVKDNFGSDFIFLTKYPISKRPMYTMPDETIEGMTRSFDLIYKGLEITTGGQRIHDYEMLKANMIKFGIDPQDFDFYVESFKYGMPPHGGFAIGLERITMKLLDLENIRESTLLPRDLTRLMP